MRKILKALLTNLADFVVSDKLDVLARELAVALDALQDARDQQAKLRAQLDEAERTVSALRAEHERQRAAHMATLRQLSDRGSDSRESAAGGDWEWARRQLGVGNAVRNRFGVDIPDEALESVTTIGELATLIDQIKAGAAS